MNMALEFFFLQLSKQMDSFKKQLGIVKNIY